MGLTDEKVLGFMNQQVGAAAEKINELAQGMGVAPEQVQQQGTLKSVLNPPGQQPGQVGDPATPAPEDVKPAEPDAAKKELVRQVIAAFNQHVQFLGNSVNLMVSIKTGQIQTQINEITDDLEYEESNIYFIRRFMRLLEHE